MVNLQTKIALTSSELGNLWTTYINNTLAQCVLSHFLKVVDDEEIKLVIQEAYQVTLQNMAVLKDIYLKENMTLPHGFGEQDVNLNAPKLFTDPFMLFYIQQMGTLGLSAYSLAMVTSSRKDIRQFFNQVLQASARLCNNTVNITLEKGIYTRPPYINPPNKVTYVTKQSFLNGWLGKRRTLNAIEINHLFTNVETNSLGKGLITGFAQVSKNHDIAQYFQRGMAISKKHIDIFSKLLADDNLPQIATKESEVLDSLIAPFSDKLMLINILFLNSAGLGNYGLAFSSSMRKDLHVHYTRLISEIGIYNATGVDLLIENGWMEQPPQSVDREALIQSRP
jgi:hypothetical protein